MLDLKGIESILSQLPNIGKLPGGPAVPARFIRHVQKEMAKTEHILKVILTTTAQTVVDTYKALVPDGNESDFQRILELKVLYLITVHCIDITIRVFPGLTREFSWKATLNNHQQTREQQPQDLAKCWVHLICSPRKQNPHNQHLTTQPEHLELNQQQLQEQACLLCPCQA